MVEVLVVTALLTVIILGLVAMFNQTQRALLAGTTQADYLESGRAATELMARDLEQMAPSGVGYTNGSAINFFSHYSLPRNPSAPGVWVPLADANEYRFNFMEQMYFLTRYNEQWKGVGYFVDSSDAPTVSNGSYNDSRRMGVGALYRYETNAAGTYPAPSIYTLSATFLNAPWATDKYYLTTPSNQVTITKLVDGVVHFRVRAYDTNGFLITQPHTNLNIISPITRRPTVDINVSSNFFQAPNLTWADEYYYTFTSNAVPAYVELELGVLESRSLSRFNGLTNNPAAALAYLTNHSAQMHLFRKRVTVRNVDPVAYQ